MAKEIKISIKSGFDPSGVADASRSIARLRDNLLTSNAELSAAIHNRAAEVAVDYSVVADKGVAHTLLSAKEIEAAWARAMGKVPTEAAKGFGKLGSIAKGALSGIGGMFGKIGNMFLQGGIWGAASAAIVGLAKVGWEAFTKKSKEAWEKVKRISEDSSKQIADDIKTINDTMREQLSLIEKIANRRRDELEATKELTKAEIELAKQHAIANGMDASAANAAAADLSATVDEEAEAKRINLAIDERKAKIEALSKAELDAQTQVANATKARADAEAKYQAEREKYIKANSKTFTFQGTQYGGVWIESYDNSAERREKEGKAFDESEDAKKMRGELKIDDFDREINDAQKTSEEARRSIEDLKAANENANMALDKLEVKREARELAAQNELAAKDKEEQKKKDEAAKVAAEKEAEAKQKLAEKTAAEQMRLDREAAAARERQAQKELDQKIKNHQKLLAAENKAEGDARTAQAKAETKLQRAWGWYRDKDSMRAQLEEEKAEAAAQKQFEKDFAKLKSKRRDWRTAENLSVDDEAVRRVGLAREEKAAADKHLAEIEKNTADLAKKLDELLQVKG